LPQQNEINRGSGGPDPSRVPPKVRIEQELLPVSPELATVNVIRALEINEHRTSGRFFNVIDHASD